MNQILRFSDYDVFAYLTAGLAALAVYDMAFGTHFVVASDWSVSDGFIVVVASYVVGHVVAALAQWLIERRLVHGFIGRPTDQLIAVIPPSGWRRVASRSFLGEYYKPLHAAVRDRLRAFMADQHLADGEALFWTAYPAMKLEAVPGARMEAFLRLYGFCRNIAFVALAAAIIFVMKAAVVMATIGWTDEAPSLLAWTAAALVIGLAMLHRYLKFHRLFAVEVLTAFADHLRKETAR